MKPTNSPTQVQPNPRKNRLKVAFGPLLSTANIFSLVGIGLYRKQTTRNPTQPTDRQSASQPDSVDQSSRPFRANQIRNSSSTWSTRANQVVETNPNAHPKNNPDKRKTDPENRSGKLIGKPRSKPKIQKRRSKSPNPKTKIQKSTKRKHLKHRDHLTDIKKRPNNRPEKRANNDPKPPRKMPKNRR